MMRPRSARYLTVAAVTLAALSVAGCGTDEDEPAAVCSSVDALEASVEDVTTVDLDRGALTELQDNLDQIRSDLSQVRDDASDEFAPEIDDLDQASTSVGSSLEAALTSPSALTITEVGTAIQALGTSMSALQEAVKSTC